MANRLSTETSPYLLQHKDNPVDWQPWGAEALARAKAEDRPILLSVGYAACHWCHVMAHESFEDTAIARRMNELFVNVKVDREERPDLDAIYQQALSMMGQQGGWPLTMFLTPAGEPFWGGTYFPPSARYGRPGFPDVLHAVHDAWTNQRDKVQINVTSLKEGLQRLSRSPGSAGLELEMLDAGAHEVLKVVDVENGGLQGAPKFPQPGLFAFLWRAWLRTSDPMLRDAVTLTLNHMSQGGIYDHLGGGFMRYSTDDRWLVPHFEKMLYDNAQMVDLLTLAWQGTDREIYRQRISETMEWVLREMTAEDGCFAATLDADSEGEEGKFYTWQADEIDRVLGDAEASRWFKMAYGVTGDGNWEDTNILHRNHPDQPQGVDELLADARAVLWREREARVRPGRDDKVLADWNGMMIAAMANAAFVFAMPRWLDAAQVAFETIRTKMTLPGGRLSHSMRHGRVQPQGMLEDYAQMARAALVLHEVTGDEAYVQQARAWVSTAETHHWDAKDGGWFQSADDAADVIVRAKPVFDAAVPAGNGTMAEVLTRLWLVTGETSYRDRAEATIAAFSALVADHFANMTSLLDAYEMLVRPVQVVVVGEPESDDTRALFRAIAGVSLPTRIMLPLPDTSQLPKGHPAHGKVKQDGLSTAYVCKAATCSPPITDAGRLRDELVAR